MATVHNHPKHGDRIKVEPIRCIEDVNRIKALLARNPRDLALFTLGVNSVLRPSELLQIRIGHVLGINPGESFEIAGKSIAVNKTVSESIDNLISAMSRVSDNDYLFQSKKNSGQPLGVSSLHRLVKMWCADAGLSGNFGSHSLRKTYGYINRTAFKVDLGQLASMFNHPYKRQTLEYLCLPPEELHNICLQEI
jgi:integrase